MKFSTLFFSLLVISLSVQAQVKFEVNGEVKNVPGVDGGLKSGDTVALKFGLLKKVFSGVVKNNKFIITGEIIEPLHAMLEYKGSGIKLLVDNSTYNVLLQSIEVSPGRFIYDSSVKTTSKFHNLWNDFVDGQIRLSGQKTSLKNKMDSSLNDEMASKYRVKWMSVDSNINKSYKMLAVNNPDNPAVAYVLPGAQDFSYRNYINSYHALSFKVRNSIYGKKLLEKP
jgi:hypothetical protein